MGEPLIRSVEPTDYSPIIAVVDEWWGGRAMAAMLPKLFFVHFRSTSFIAEVDGSMVGFLIGLISQAARDEAYIHFAGIHPNFRAAGFGRALYEHFFSTARQLGCRTVRCVTSPVNMGSVAFHRRMGFSAEAGDIFMDGMPVFKDYDGPGEHRVLFVRSLVG